MLRRAERLLRLNLAEDARPLNGGWAFFAIAVPGTRRGTACERYLLRSLPAQEVAGWRQPVGVSASSYADQYTQLYVNPSNGRLTTSGSRHGTASFPQNGLSEKNQLFAAKRRLIVSNPKE
jgi:hypothetical protein